MCVREVGSATGNVPWAQNCLSWNVRLLQMQRQECQMAFRSYWPLALGGSHTQDNVQVLCALADLT